MAKHKGQKAKNKSKKAKKAQVPLGPGGTLSKKQKMQANKAVVAKLMNFTAARQTSDEPLPKADLYKFGVLLYNMFVKNFGGNLLDRVDPNLFAESMDPRFAANFPELAVLLHSIGAQGLPEADVSWKHLKCTDCQCNIFRHLSYI